MANCPTCGRTLDSVITDREDGFGTEACPHCGNICGGAMGANSIGEPLFQESGEKPPEASLRNYLVGVAFLLGFLLIMFWPYIGKAVFGLK